jgi:hypothetical protein
MNNCEMTGCTRPVFTTAFPNKQPVKLCREHFISEMGHLINPNTPVVDVPSVSPNKHGHIISTETTTVGNRSTESGDIEELDPDSHHLPADIIYKLKLIQNKVEHMFNELELNEESITSVLDTLLSRMEEKRIKHMFLNGLRQGS